jgi:hypothetical protein
MPEGPHALNRCSNMPSMSEPFSPESSQEAIETGLIGGLGEFPMEAEDGLALSDHQSGEVFGEMVPLGLIGEQIPKMIEGVVNDRGKVDDGGHDQVLR